MTSAHAKKANLRCKNWNFFLYWGRFWCINRWSCCLVFFVSKSFFSILSDYLVILKRFSGIFFTYHSPKIYYNINRTCVFFVRISMWFQIMFVIKIFILCIWNGWISFCINNLFCLSINILNYSKLFSLNLYSILKLYNYYGIVSVNVKALISQ